MEGHFVDPVVLDAALHRQFLCLSPTRHDGVDDGVSASVLAREAIETPHYSDDNIRPLEVVTVAEAFAMGWDIALKSACAVIASPLQDVTSELRAIVEPHERFLFDALCADAKSEREEEERARARQTGKSSKKSKAA